MAKIERTKNASRNIIFGIILKIYQLAIPFIMRTIMIYTLGVQYLGLNSLFTSILQVLNLAELGVGAAMVYSMYKPIVENDSKKICALMHLYKVYYRGIGLIICVIGIVITPFIPNLISGNVPSDINVYVIYLLNLFATVFSYWLFAYKNSILQAHQRIDVTSKVLLVTETIKYALQIFVLVVIRNYYLFLIISLLSQILTNILTAYISNLMYPNYQAKGNLDKLEVRKINRRIRDLFTSKIGGVIVNSADSIVISAFLGLSVLAIYQNYFYLITAVIGLIGIVFSSVTAAIGNSIVVDSKEKVYKDFRMFTFIIAWIAGVCTNCFLNLFQPFMKVWVGEDLLLPFSVVICFCVYFFVYEINQLLNSYKDASGIWHEDRFRPLVTALTNLFLNLIMVQFLEIYGIILSTVLSTLIVGMPWLLHNLFTVLFDRENLIQYVMSLLQYVMITFITLVFTFMICNQIVLDGWMTIFARLIICLIVPNIIYVIIYHDKIEFTGTLKLINRMTRNKLPLINKMGD